MTVYQSISCEPKCCEEPRNEKFLHLQTFHAGGMLYTWMFVNMEIATLTATHGDLELMDNRRVELNLKPLCLLVTGFITAFLGTIFGHILLKGTTEKRIDYLRYYAIYDILFAVPSVLSTVILQLSFAFRIAFFVIPGIFNVTGFYLIWQVIADIREETVNSKGQGQDQGCYKLGPPVKPNHKSYVKL